ncbi:hypothetical protein FKM82_011011 [Ascaphus truei]
MGYVTMYVPASGVYYSFQTLSTTFPPIWTVYCDVSSCNQEAACSASYQGLRFWFTCFHLSHCHQKVVILRFNAREPYTGQLSLLFVLLCP